MIFKRVKVVTNRAPYFLKETYPNQRVELIDHAGFVKRNERYITWDGTWRVWRMRFHNGEFIPVYQGVFDNLNSAIFQALK